MSLNRSRQLNFHIDDMSKFNTSIHSPPRQQTMFENITMEPMALGSPTGSTTQSPSSPATNYLPNFLLGDPNMPSRLGATPESSRFANTSGMNQTSPLSSYGNPEYRTNRQRAMFANVSGTNGSQINTENHVGGPPTRGLFDTLETSISTQVSTLPPPMSPINVVNESKMNRNRNFQSRNNFTSFMDLQMNANSSNSNENSSQSLLQWITVFGFPTEKDRQHDCLNTVLSFISSRVRIVDKHLAPHPQCNWIHLKCSADTEAQRALACNGNVVSGSIMIGVIPCTEEGVILGADKENRAKFNGTFSHYASPLTSPKSPGRKSGVRPLISRYSHTSPQTVQSPECIPQKSTGVVSKAMEYVFGW